MSKAITLVFVFLVAVSCFAWTRTYPSGVDCLIIRGTRAPYDTTRITATYICGGNGMWSVFTKDGKDHWLTEPTERLVIIKGEVQK